MSRYYVRIRGEYGDDDGLRVDMRALEPGQAWWDVALPSCPDCGGDIVWYEAGYVPGTRKCMGKPVRIVDDAAYDDGKRRVYDVEGGCGSFFSVQDGEGRVWLRRERFYS